MKNIFRLKLVAGLSAAVVMILPNIVFADWRAYCDTHRTHAGWLAYEEGARNSGADHFDDYQNHPQTIYIEKGEIGNAKRLYHMTY